MMLKSEVPASIVSKWDEFKFYLTPPVSWWDYRPDPVVVRTLGLGLFVLGIWALAYHLGKQTKRSKVNTGEREMAKHFRNRHVAYFVGENVTEFVEEGIHKGKITVDEGEDIYNKFGREFGLTDLLPRKLRKARLSRGEVEHLKTKIKERIASQTVSDKVVPIKKKVGQFLKK